MAQGQGLRSLRVMVVDDTAMYRKLLRDILSPMAGVEVVGTASNGRQALDQIAALQPDLLTLDIEMPTMDGLDTLRHLREAASQVGAVMVSAHTKHGAKVTMEALQLGAFDFITKPEGADASDSMEQLRRQLQPVIRVYRAKTQRLEVKIKSEGVADASGDDRGVNHVVRRMRAIGLPADIRLVAIGISTGGPQALACLIPRLPIGLGVPIVIVQHMPPMFTGALADSLDQKSQLAVVEAQHGQVLKGDTVYIAPGGKQMQLEPAGGHVTPCVSITDDPPENHCKPSVDYLFRSVAHHYGRRALGIIMTGMGADGVLGLRLMKQQGAVAIAQDEASCVVFGMPKEAIAAGVVDAVLPLEQIADEICKRVRKT